MRIREKRKNPSSLRGLEARPPSTPRPIFLPLAAGVRWDSSCTAPRAHQPADRAAVDNGTPCQRCSTVRGNRRGQIVRSRCPNRTEPDRSDDGTARPAQPALNASSAPACARVRLCPSAPRRKGSSECQSRAGDELCCLVPSAPRPALGILGKTLRGTRSRVRCASLSPLRIPARSR